MTLIINQLGALLSNDANEDKPIAHLLHFLVMRMMKGYKRIKYE